MAKMHDVVELLKKEHVSTNQTKIEGISAALGRVRQLV